MNRLLKKQDGFTLLELLIVIVIIGILAVLIIPNLVSGPQRGRDATRKSDLRTIKQALESYYNDNSVYPSATSGCEPTQAACLGDPLSTGSTPYLKTIPKDPKGDQSYAYKPVSGPTPTSYTLEATLENKKDSAANSSGVYIVNSLN